MSEMFAKVILDLRNEAQEPETPEPSADELEAAMRFVALWMRYFTFTGITDGEEPGVVRSDQGVARCVVSETRPAGRRVVQEVWDQGAADGRYPLVFCRSGFTEQAVRWADKNPVALFSLEVNGDISPENLIAARLLEGSDRKQLD